MNLERIKIIAERQRVPIKRLADTIGMSESNLHRCVRENKIQAQDLEKIASELGVKVGVFFGEDSSVHIEVHDNGQGAGREIFNGFQKAEVQRLKDMIDHLEERIQDKQATIDARSDHQRKGMYISNIVRQPQVMAISDKAVGYSTGTLMTLFLIAK